MTEDATLDALKALVLRHVGDGGEDDGILPTAIDGVALLHARGDVLPKHTLYRPALCVVVQGAKQVMFGDRIVDYAAMQALIVSVEMPGRGRITCASREAPYLAMVVEIDVGILRSILTQLDPPPSSAPGDGFGVFVAAVDGALADCMVRLLRLLDNPRAIPVLHPALMREICYWLLSGPYGGDVARLALPTSHARRIADAIHRLRDNFTRPLRVQDLAETAGMSLSTFHQHFKTLTAMSPLQYQKQLRLLEARRLLLDTGTNAEAAAYEVGYESASQFSREYARMFGMPPKRDAVTHRMP